MEKELVGWIEKELGKPISITEEKYGDQSNVYRLQFSNTNYFLKIGLGLEKERERLEWLNGKLPVPKVVDFIHINNKDALLLSEIEGKNLAELKKKWSADKVVNKLVEALQRLHNTDTKDFPFMNIDLKKVLVHGDACLPNFIFKDDVFSGYIDLGELAIDNKEVDLSAAIWSLQYNLGPGYGLEFLQKYGISGATEELVEELRLQYEKTQEAWGLK